MGWTNELQVYGSVPEATDTLSHVDILRFTGPLQASTWGGRPFTAIESGIEVTWPNDSFELILDGTEGSFDIHGGAVDSAGNWREIIVHGGYETIAPTCSVLSFENSDTSSFPSTIPMNITDEPGNGHIWKVCYYIVDIDTVVCAPYRDEWGAGPDYEVDFTPGEFLDPYELYNIEAVALDSAGNASDVVPINLWGKLDFKVVDINDTTDSDYTGSQTVLTIINASTEPDSMRFGENTGELQANPWIPFSRTHEFEFANPDNITKYVYAQVKFGNYTTSMDNFDTIILDTIPPSLSSIDAYDPDTDDPDWSVSQEVKIVINGASDVAPGVVHALLVSESPDFDYNLDTLVFDPEGLHEVYYTVADEAYEPGADADPDFVSALHAGERRIFARVWDHAENASSIKEYDITVDWETTEVINFPNPFNPDKGPTYIRVKSDKAGANVDINIYDMFGNPVWSGSTKLKANSRGGQIEWDGTNDDGDIVGNGGYICIADFGDKTAKRKIAVWKGE